MIRRGSKTMKNDNMFSNELDCQDTRFASSSSPLRHHIDGVSSPLTCASVLCIRRVDQTQLNWGDSSQERTVLELKEEAECLGTEMNSGLTQNHRATAQLTSTKPGNSSSVLTTTVVQVGCRLQVAGFRDHNLRRAFWMEYFSDPLQISILKRNLDLQIMEHLMQSSKRHYSWHTLGTRLCHK